MKKVLQQNKNTRTKVMVSMLVLLIILAGSVIAYQKLHKDNPVIGTTGNTGINYGPASEEDQKEAEDAKISKLEDQPTPQTPAPDSAKVTISSATQDPDTKDLIVQTRLDGTGWKSCTLTAKKSGSPTVTVQSQTIYQPEFSVCAGFAIKASQFSISGTWTIELSVALSNGKIVTAKSVDAQVKL